MKLKTKKHTIALICATMVLSSAIGVSAASVYSSVRSHGLLSYDGGSVVIDADAIGYWIEPGINIAQGATSVVIEDKNIKADSIVEIYYSNTVVDSTKGTTSIDVISTAEPQYTQENGKVTVTFRKPQKIKYDGISIESVHITNPVNVTVE